MRRLFSFDWLLFVTLLSTAWLSVAFFQLAGYTDTTVTVFDLFFGDIVPVSIVLALALYTRNRFASIAFVLTSVFAILLRIGAYCLYKFASLPFRFRSLSLLLEHYDHRSAQTMVGEYYLPLTILGILLVTGLIIILSRVTVRAIRNCTDRERDLRLIVVLILTLTGFAAHVHILRQQEIYEGREDYYTGHGVTPMPFLVGDLLDDMIHVILPAEERSGFTKGSFTCKEDAFLTDSGLINAPPQGKALEKPFDRILIIALESMDNDFLSSVNPEMPEGLTAGMDALKKQYVSFDNFFCAALPTSWGLNTFYLSRVDYFQDLNIRNSVFCNILRQEHGIRSCYFSPTDGSFGDNREHYKNLFAYDHGFFGDDLSEQYGIPLKNKYWGISDPDMFRAVAQFLQEEKWDKYFILVSTMDSHAPYTPSGPARDDGKFTAHGDFYQTIHCVDRNVTDFVNRFTADPELFNDRTLLIITADHAAAHGDNYTRRSGLGYPARVPLIMISKNNRAAKYFDPVKDKYCSSIDLPATLLAMLGTKIPESFMGQDIRTKRSFALGKTNVNEFLLFLPDSSYHVIDVTKEPKETKRHALYKFYQQYYPAQQ